MHTDVASGKGLTQDQARSQDFCRGVGGGATPEFSNILPGSPRKLHVFVNKKFKISEIKGHIFV